MSAYRILALERQYASGGRAVGKMVADALGIPCYNREILEYAAERSGQTPEHLERLEESANTSIFFAFLSAYGRKARGEAPLLSPEDTLLLSEAEVIRDLAEEGPCVLIGRSAGCILRDRQDVLRAFLYADEESRIRRAVDEYGHDENEALNVLRFFDRRRANFYNANYNLEWEDKGGYHLCLDTGKLGLEACAHILLEALKA
ncbi:MAG: AAA family ATPase [Candidatus Spyradocola sp.]|jgi:cytidylate kinase